MSARGSGQAGSTRFGLPDVIDACLFDLDGVLTDTAAVHATAWKQTFDALLATRGQEPFDAIKDYREYVDGKPREDGVRAFLAARGIHLPDGGASDPPDAETVAGLAHAKDDRFERAIQAGGVKRFEGSVAYLTAVRRAGLRTAVVSSSRHTTEVLVAADLAGSFDAQVDGNVAAARGLAGKPAPDTFLAAARMLGVDAAQAAVFEDALAGVAAGRAGRFGYVVGVDRAGHPDQLVAHGADVAVSDLADLLSDT